MTSQPFEKMPVIPTPQQVVDIAFRKAMKLQARGGISPLSRARRHEEQRIKVISDTLISTLARIVKGTPRLDDLHPFYFEIVAITVGTDGFKLNLAKIAVCQRIITRLTRQYVLQTRRAETAHRAVTVRRAFMGRTASLVRGIDEPLGFLREARERLSRLPTAEPSTISVVIAGCPNAGKSTLVSRLSSAKPEIAQYPFTTKEIVVGHAIFDRARIQVIDTPGLLDRPLKDRNKLELKAIAALRHLATMTIYLFDVSYASAYTIRQQHALYDEIQTMFQTMPMIVVINKIDEAAPEAADELKARLQVPIVEVSALKGIGIEDLKSTLRITLQALSRPRKVV